MLGNFDIQDRLLIDVNVESYDEDATQDGIMILDPTLLLAVSINGAMKCGTLKQPI